MSTVAQLRQRIAQECEAMNQALTGYRVSTKHEIIANRYRNLDDIHTELTELVGEQEATKITAEAYIEVMG